MKTGIVIFSGYNQRAVIAFLRTLVKNDIKDYAIIAASNQDMILKTQYREKVLFIRNKKELIVKDILKVLMSIKEYISVDKLLIAPSTEALNRFLLENRKKFEEKGCIIPLAAKELYYKVSDKESFYQMCTEYGLEVPPIINLDDKFEQPFVAKPKQYFDSKGKVHSPYIILNEQDYSEFRKECNVNDFSYQKYLEGDSYYILFYFSRKHEVFVNAQKNLAQQFGGKSIILAVADKLYKERIVKQYQKMFLANDFYGLVMVEIRKVHDKYYMIEANPRFWGPSQLFCDMGYNFFEFLLWDFNLLENKPMIKINSEAKYYWSGGMDTTKDIKDRCVWYSDGELFWDKYYDEVVASDIYNREDTINLYEEETMGYEPGCKGKIG